MEQLKAKVQQLQQEVEQAVKKLNIAGLEKQLADLRQQMQAPDFWADSKRAQELSKQEAALNSRVEPWEQLQTEAVEIEELIKLGDAGLTGELTEKLAIAESQLSTLKRQLRFNGPYDDHGVILSIHAGAGGTDAQDWAQMLLRMYSRWAEVHKVKVKMLNQSAGEEAGIKSVTIELSGGEFLYGKLAGEPGVHRLVRLSPFNADNLRQTSFAKVEIVPKIDRPEELELDEKDLKIDVFRAGGHGGQSVNTTDSAVRITHIPTGVSVAIQNERSQLQNKETALTILRSKLVQLQLQQHKEKLDELKGPSQSAEWGNQIRSYVLHPYKQVKDLRTGYESSDPEAVLDGRLDPIINSWAEQESLT